ncbi:hypothetical protein BG005_004644 [Podila minutissima]|nr:hypothetical protein BG005_004644 [Podila minutissima]
MTPQHQSTVTMDPDALNGAAADDGMEIDHEEYSQDISMSSSLPTSFLSTPRAFGGRRVSTPAVESPVEYQPIAVPPKPRKMLDLDQWDRDSGNDIAATPSKSFGVARTLGQPLVHESSPTPEGGSLLGKHPHSSSPSLAEGRLRSKGPNNYTNFPKPPKFTLTESLAKGKQPAFTVPAGSDLVPLPTPPAPLGFSPLFQPSSRRSSIESNESENPFLGSSKPKLNFTLDYLVESQWYSDYPHHITKEYLDELFQLDKRVMFTSIKTGPRNYPDYLTTNYFVSTSTLGQGDFAEVLKVQSKTNKEFYAIKKLRRTVQGAHERKKYLNEVRNMWQIERSPHVLQLLEAWEQKGQIYMKMELCKLGSLRSALRAQKKYGGFDEKRIWKCLTDLATGLRAIHDSNIIHMDLKPGNVFISSTGSLRIGDFGHSITYPVQEKDIAEGDKYYMAQELLNQKCGKFSDVFSLGMIVYEMVTNRTDSIPGEGPEWHRLRDGELGLEDFAAPEAASKASDSRPASPTSTPGSRGPESLLSSGSSLSESVLSSPLMDQNILTVPTVSSKIGAQTRLFSSSMLSVIKDLMQPEFECRPTVAAIQNVPNIRTILARRKDGRGLRTETAMQGLLLQSI